jgi:hypothetical protein
MIKDVNELKEFILWARSQKVKTFKINEISIEMSEYAFLADVAEQFPVEGPTKAPEQTIQTDLIDASEAEKPTNEDLFWSAR